VTKNFQCARRLQVLPEYLFDIIAMKKAEAVAKGKDVIDLGVGDPDLPSPLHVVEALKKAVDDPSHHRYSSFKGMQELRETFAAWFFLRYGVDLDPDGEILPLIGSKEGIGHIHLALVDPGDKVLVPDPGYPTFQGGTILAGGIPVYYPLLPGRGFMPDLQSIEKMDLRGVKIMHINFPSNPTTAVADLDFFRQMVKFGRRHGIIVCHDAAYAELFFDEPCPSFLQARGAMEVGVEFHSLSKTYNMTGWRLGFAAGNRDIVKALGKVKANYDTGVFSAVQRAGIAALSGDQGCVQRSREIFRKRRDIFIEGLASMGLEAVEPRATFYVWSPVPGGYTSMEFAEKILEKTAVVVTPGSGFGEYGEGYFRTALTVPESRLQEAIDRMSHSNI